MSVTVFFFHGINKKCKIKTWLYKIEELHVSVSASDNRTQVMSHTDRWMGICDRFVGAWLCYA